MQPNTGPAELAEILGDPEKRERWIVFALLDIKNNLAAHMEKDAQEFDEARRERREIAARVGGVSSSVETEKEKNSYSMKEMIAGFLVLCGALGGLITFIAWAIGNAGKGAP